MLEGVDDESLSEMEFHDSPSSQDDLCEEEVSGYTPLWMHLNPVLEDWYFLDDHWSEGVGSTRGRAWPGTDSERRGKAKKSPEREREENQHRTQTHETGC